MGLKPGQSLAVNIYYATPHVQQLPPGHRFPMGKYERLRQRLGQELPELRLSLADPVSDGELALVHSPAYIEAVATGNLGAAQQREIGFPWSPGMVERARRSSGATVMAARSAMREGLAANLAGGTHHAYPDKGSGFCVFNDAAVCARLMQAEWLRSHRHPLAVAIIDWTCTKATARRAFSRMTPVCSPCPCMGPKTFLSAKRPATWTWPCPTAVATMSTWLLWSRPC